MNLISIQFYNLKFMFIKFDNYLIKIFTKSLSEDPKNIDFKFSQKYKRCNLQNLYEL